MALRKTLILIVVISVCIMFGMAWTAFAEEVDPGGEVKAISFTPANPAQYELDYHTHGHMEQSFQYSISRSFRVGDSCTLTILTPEGDTIEKEYKCQYDKKLVFVEVNSSEDILPASFFSKSDVQKDSEGNFFVTVKCQNASCSYPVTITKPKAIEYIPANPVVAYEGEGIDPATGKYSVSHLMELGDQLIVTEEDGTTHTYVYRIANDEPGTFEGLYCFICDETGDVLNNAEGNNNDMDVKLTSDQDKTPWEPGAYDDHPGNYMLVNYSDLECKVPVELVASPIESITFEPVEPFEVVENVGGWVDSETGVYHYPSPVWHDGDQLTVHYRDGTTETYTAGSGGPAWNVSTLMEAMYEFPDQILLIDTQETDSWLTGKDNYVTIAYRGKTCKAPVKIISDHVVGFEYIPLHPIVLVENISGFTLTASPGQYDGLEEPVEYFCYTDLSNIFIGDRLVVEYDDDRGIQSYIWTQTDRWHRKFVNENNPGDVIDVEKPGDILYFQDNQSYPNQWLPGKTNEMTLVFHNHTYTLQVEIIPQTEEFVKAYKMKWHELHDPEFLEESEKDKVLEMWGIYQGLSDGEQYAFDHQGGGYYMEDYMNSCVIKGHSWDAPKYSWSTDGRKATASRVCSKYSSHKETEKATVFSKITMKATYTAKGQTTYTAFFKNSAFAKQTITKTDVPKRPKVKQPMSVSVDTTNVNAGKLEKKKLKIKPIKVKKAKGKVTYKVVGGNKKSKKALSVNEKTGVVTVRKKTAKGKYVIKVKITAAGTSKYKVGSKTVKVKITVN